MFKTVGNHVWVFDMEWVPCATSGRRAYNLPNDMTDADVVERMWQEAGATEENPRPFLKTMLCRVVSLSAVTRHVVDGQVHLKLLTLPKITASDSDTSSNEAEIIGSFLDAVGNYKPQLVGFNSEASDVLILIQRAIANGLSAPGFASRPDKPWEGIDYFNQHSDAHVDLIKIVGGYGNTRPSLHQFATACGIPGKMDVAGNEVYELWMAGKIQDILEYNEFDALTTYLCWLRTAHFGGFLNNAEYIAEQAQLRELLENGIKTGHTHYQRYLETWDRLQSVN